MTTTDRRRVEGCACVMVDAPSTWSVADAAPTPSVETADLVLVGPRRGDGPRPKVSVRVLDDAGAVAGAPLRVWEALRRHHPHAVFTSSEMWPHPVWGDGHHVQTARVERHGTLAHDCYVFDDAGRAVQIEVECALADLLPLEDQVADIVAHVRPKVA